MKGLSITGSDWFLSAIVKEGSVDHCLKQVIEELDRKKIFVQKLKENFAKTSSPSLDGLSDLSQRTRVLESTLKYRLSILVPERRQSWFRPSSTSASGPFSGKVLSDPIFSVYPEAEWQKVRQGLVDSWRKKSLVPYPLKASETCIWKHVLVLNYEIHQLGDLGEWPRLERIVDELPSELDSRALKAFLSNVRSEYLSVRERLNHLYEQLLAASHQFWSVYSKEQTSSSELDHDDMSDAAERVSQTFKRRRSHSATLRRPLGKSSQDLEALKFMGFEDFPNAEELKLRFHHLALKMHPDREGGNEARFKLLARSYKHLAKVCL